MRVKFTASIAAAALSVCLAVVPALSGAWGNVGHETVLAIAWSNLTPTARAKAQAILAADPRHRTISSTGQSTNIATWPDYLRAHRVNPSVPTHASRHFVDLPYTDGQDLPPASRAPFYTDQEAVLQRIILNAADLTLIKALYLALGITNEPCINDMLTEGANGQPYTPFLKALNVETNGPDYATAQYYTLSGTNWKTYGEPWAAAVETLYVMADLLDSNQWEEDGLIATYSAQTKILQKLSRSWKAGPKLPINHGQMVTDQISFDHIGDILTTP